MVDGDALSQLIAGLREAGISFVQTHHEPVYTSVEAARVRGTSLQSGAKALIVKADDAFVVVVIPADLSLDNGALRRHLGCRRLRFATKEELLDLTGLAPGSVPPFGSLFGLPTICDECLSDNERINFNAGSHTDSIQMTYEAYVTYESPRIAKVAKPTDPPAES